MHQPYYRNLLTGESDTPWVRLHAAKDYLAMAQMLEDYPEVKLTFNFVPSLLEQIGEYAQHSAKDKYLELSLRPAKELNPAEKDFLLSNFFSINKDKVICRMPRYYELLLKRQEKKEFSQEDYLDLQVLFNLSWIDPFLRQANPELKRVCAQERFFSEEDKQTVLKEQIGLLKNIIPVYKKLANRGQIELSLSPYYHPILPLVYNTNIAKEALPKTTLPQKAFSWPQDAQKQVERAVNFFRDTFALAPAGMWPSEQSVSEHILEIIISAGINWLVTDEAILFKSLQRKKRDTRLLYQPHSLKKEGRDLNIIFRDRNLSDLIGFVYQGLSAEAAVKDFLGHLEDIARAFKGQDTLVTVALDGENAWEYYQNNGRDFLGLLYKKLSQAENIRTTSITGYLKGHPPKYEIKRLAAGSWIFGNFGKWLGNPYKNKAWEYLAIAREELQASSHSLQADTLALAYKQMFILEGSDWFWWYGEDPQGQFDRLFRMHLNNFYQIIAREVPDYLKKTIAP
jgi:alpha-amylase/alpha-mannosidase (GH57 family)